MQQGGFETRHLVLQPARPPCALIQLGRDLKELGKGKKWAGQMVQHVWSLGGTTEPCCAGF